MSNNQEKAKVVDEKCKATTSNSHEQDECGYWIHINHFFNCYPDCKIYVNSFNHYLKRKAITKYGLILIPLSHKISNISNVVECVICDDKNCYFCKNLKEVADGRKTLCSCNEDLRDDHAVTRINWFISNFKMCVTMKERCKSNSKANLSKQKNDDANKTKGENDLKEPDQKRIESNNADVNSEYSQHVVDEYCECDIKINAVVNSSGIKKKYSKMKAKNMNRTLKLNENVSSKSPEVNDGNIREQNEKPLIDDKKIQSPLPSSGAVKKNYGSKSKGSASHNSDLQILTRNSLSRFVEKFDSLNAFGHQCLFCKILGYYYDGKYCDVIIPDFCIADRRQTTCEKSANELDCFGKQYCLTVENAYEEPGVGPKLIGAYTRKNIPLTALDKGMNFDKNSKYPESNFEKSKIIKKKKSRMTSCSEEMKKGEKKE